VEASRIVLLDGSDANLRFFAATLARMEPLLRANLYCGYINLNTIVNEQGIWPLEFTCRFGYPGFAVLDPLQITSWPQLFRMMLTKPCRDDGPNIRAVA
jgi:phosphoribosylamine--glycine ligase